MTARIPLSSPDITQAEIDAVTAVLRTPHLSMGPELAAFEAALAAYHSVSHAVCISTSLCSPWASARATKSSYPLSLSSP
jgi:dTDP-4-amino-4,6-dideoxygalactose transaminase